MRRPWMGWPGRVTHATAQGLRAYQEDRAIVHWIERQGRHAGLLMAVLDGHGGADAVDTAAATLSEIIARELAKTMDAKTVLRNAVAALVSLAKDFDSGSTLSLVLLSAEQAEAHVAILGDSAVLIRDAAGELHVSPSHNARSNLAERERAVRRGALYQAGYLHDPATGVGLQLTRALGDRVMGPYLSREPELYSVSLGHASTIIVASDGVFDPSHEHPVELQRFFQALDAGHDAAWLVNDALNRNTGDNATAIVWKTTYQTPSQ